MLKVYNTLTKQKDEFKPFKKGEISIYVCGVTPYNHPHIGNARPFVTWDVIKRYLKKCGYHVKHVQNFTDIDDKIIRTANSEGVKWSDISTRYIDAYFEVMDKLNVQRADVYPKVSEHIPDILAMIQTLVDKGYAYPMDGDVYFSVEKFAGYGKLSGRKLDDMQAGARVEVDDRKQNPMDFALWKAAKTGEPAWESPWGSGRPGWHIECSTMSLKYLGETFDFHGGGSDLIFPHHENEIAQSQACCGHDDSFAHYWLHNGFITINQEKMSKSLNNFFTVKDILEKYPAEVLRFFIIETHYRSPLDFSDERLKESQTSLNRLNTAMENVYELEKQKSGQVSAASKALVDAALQAQKDFYESMDDDFNTALALSYMFALAKEINIYYHAVTTGEIEHAASDFAQAEAVYEDMADILGILVADGSKIAEEDTGMVEDLMKLIIELRQQARVSKDWTTADKIRDDLKAIGVTLEDSPTGIRWKK
ncbi:cysteinyl-tRNA synthetase [Propionispira arboris]|uniref:Cysteine--tRNA ligase n=1 Tax=Propionispira arboris TaxID=84035 RepID=A0A1H6YCG6_9FIRM|nr:cysteine--tRNA ligase [Propionispira arboris]SEJ38186.1 cysteinyl-tRNA synthetase [Propionispira arboris]